MGKKIFKLTPIGAAVGLLKGKKKKPAETAAPVAETKGGPIVTPLGGTNPAIDPRRRGKRPIPGTIIGGGLNTTLGG